MKVGSSTLLYLQWLCAMLHTASALSLHESRDAAPRVVKFDLHRNYIRDPIEHDNNHLAKRDNTVSTTLRNDQSLYALNISVGTPPQDVVVNIDTGSSDLWLNFGPSGLCSHQRDPCKAGTYNANRSSTYEYVGSWFNISYADGSGASGDYVNDTLRISGSTVKDFQFGVGYRSSSPQNILGIGYPVNEAQVANADMDPYPNLPVRLASDGTIASRAYSLWLNSLDASHGNLLFGGVDRSQYEGDLVSVPIQRGDDDQDFTEFFVTLTSMDLDGENIVEDLGLAVLLDSGTSLTYLPNSIVRVVYEAVGAVYLQSQGSPVVPCSLAKQNVNMTFSFSDPAQINVAISELVLPINLDLNDPGAPNFVDAHGNRDQACLFGLLPNSGRTAVLGETFLRSAYVVFDLENNEISLAQALMNATDSDVVEISNSKKNPVPSAIDAEEDASATIGLPDGATVTETIGSSGGNGGGDGGDEDDAAGVNSLPSFTLLAVVFASVLVGAGVL